MESCEVLIVGGGPAGSTCAWSLRNHGHDVVVMDKAHFPRDKVCAGWITPVVLEELRIATVEYAAGRVLQPITGFLTGAISGPTVRTDYDHVVSYGIRRCEFDQFLLNRSQARLRLGDGFRSARFENGEWIVNESLKARWLIGAGGHFCPVARNFSDPDAGQAVSVPVVLAQEVEFAMSDAQQSDCAVIGTHPELYFCRDLQGYGWVFRKDNVINIGMGREQESRLSEHVAAFCEFLRSRDRIRFALPTRFHGHAYRLRTHVPRVVASNLLLIGDAAGLAAVHSGEGIRPAIESGLLAAKVICEFGHDPATAASQYVARLQARLEFGSSEPLIRWLPAAPRAAAGRWLLRSRWFTRHKVLDDWFLNVAQPALSL